MFHKQARSVELTIELSATLRGVGIAHAALLVKVDSRKQRFAQDPLQTMEGVCVVDVVHRLLHGGATDQCTSGSCTTGRPQRLSSPLINGHPTPGHGAPD